MGSVHLDMQLVQGVLDGNFDVVKALLEAGVNVNGSPGQPYAPIVAAAIADNAGMIELLLQRGADPDRPVTLELPSHSPDAPTAAVGKRALHIAAGEGSVEIVRLLLQRSGADPNVADHRGRTPLMATSGSPQLHAEVVRLLLEAGASPLLAQEKGYLPLHLAVFRGHMDLVDMLYSGAPTTLNRRATNGMTPLFIACNKGFEGIVSKLLSLGAVQPPVHADDSTSGAVQPVHDDEISATCLLELAVSHGFAGVVRLLLTEGGIRAIGGKEPLTKALCTAIRFRQSRILRLLLAVDGDEKISEWANAINSLEGAHMLHYGAGFCYPVAVGILLEAGADEAAHDAEGRIPRGVIGLCLGRFDEHHQMDQGKEVAVRRMLQRGPAYRARSWAWPSDEAKADAGGSGIVGGTAAAAVAALSSPSAAKTPPAIGVRMSRPKEKSGNKFFVRLVGRYCAKD